MIPPLGGNQPLSAVSRSGQILFSQRKTVDKLYLFKFDQDEEHACLAKGCVISLITTRTKSFLRDLAQSLAAWQLCSVALPWDTE